MIKFIHDKDYVPKDIINLVEDIRKLSSLFKGIRMDYFRSLVNRETNAMPKNSHVYSVCYVCG